MTSPSENRTVSEVERKPRDAGTRCRFCRDRLGDLSYRDLTVFARMVSTRGKLPSRRRLGSCAAHQRSLSAAIKHARFLALLSCKGW